MAIALIPTLAVSAALVAGIGAGAVPVSLAISPTTATLSGQSFQVAADSLEGTGFTQYLAVDSSARGDFPEAVSAIGSAELHNLCQSVVSSLPGIGKVTMLIKAGGGSKPVHADQLIVDTDALEGDATFRNIQIGADAAQLPGDGRAKGPSGAFGQQADSVRIDHLRQTTRSINAATFQLNGLHLTVKKGAQPCF
ncbi:DUF6230 family protein [Streptomyces sp. MI02-7b]|uniref:DUF6230 family protein n=1 Tax=Streptomyces sp. MI02-7b TaxID=462941 RepID=UPI0029AC07B2|nr:DUF6230 family protein [Streptomyces sp. MI02-7b]MDX3073576.1 DUF6230 family protein [Streptomyces sp. MI02-7b]